MGHAFVTNVEKSFDHLYFTCIILERKIEGKDQ